MEFIGYITILIIFFIFYVIKANHCDVPSFTKERNDLEKMQKELNLYKQQLDTLRYLYYKPIIDEYISLKVYSGWYDSVAYYEVNGDKVEFEEIPTKLAQLKADIAKNCPCPTKTKKK